MNKYHNIPTYIDGVRFSSGKEARRWHELQLLERAGDISELRRQVRYHLNVNGVHICDYVADFTYKENGFLEVEDSKGNRTREYIIKRNLMLACHGITIKET
jgi:hypothetical protein